MKYYRLVSLLAACAVLVFSPVAALADEPVETTESPIEAQVSLQIEQPTEAVTEVTEITAQNTAEAVEAAETAEVEAAVTNAAGTAVTEAATDQPATREIPADTWYGVPSGAGSRVMRGRRNFLWPVPSSVHLSSCFNDPMGHGSTHYAIDIRAAYGASVTAAYDGTVAAVRYNGNKDNGYGNSVIVLHKDVLMADGSIVDLYTRYSHMSAICVEVGETVKAGETEVGRVGGTGSGYEPYSPHLDFQILIADDSKEDSWSVPSKYSIDPYRNELMEIPEGLTASGGADAWCACCYDYVAYIRSLYSGKVKE